MTSFSSATYNILNYIRERCPNPVELLFRGIPKVAIEKALEAYGFDFGYNPATSHVLREVVNLVVFRFLSANKIMKVKIGFSNNTYDDGIFYSTAVSVGCKAIVIAGTAIVYPQVLTNKKTFQLTVTSANFICEVPARYLAIASKERQDTNKTNIEFFTYVSAEGKPSWTVEAIFSGLSRITVSTFVAGKLAELSGVGKLMNKGTIKAEYTFVRSISQDMLNEFDDNDGIHQRIQQTKEAFTGNTDKVVACSAVLLLDTSGKFLAEFITAYIQVPLTKLTQDLFGDASRNIYELLYSPSTEEAILTKENITEESKLKTVGICELDTSTTVYFVEC